MKKLKTVIIGIIVTAVSLSIVLYINRDMFLPREKSEYSLTEKEYVFSDEYEEIEYDVYTVTKYMATDVPTVIVKFRDNGRDVLVSVSARYKFTSVYADDGSSYDFYMSEMSDKYAVEKDFSNTDDIVQLAFDWSSDTYMGNYTE